MSLEAAASLTIDQSGANAAMLRLAQAMSQAKRGNAAGGSGNAYAAVSSAQAQLASAMGRVSADRARLSLLV